MDPERRREMLPLLREWRASGESLRGFMRERGVSYHTAVYWKRRLSSELEAAGADEVRLVEVAMRSESLSRAESITIELRCGRRVTVPSTMPAPELQHLIGTIESC